MTDLTTQVLVEIRDEIRELRHDTNERFGEVNQRLDKTNQRLDETNQRLTVLAQITQGIDGRLEKIEEREPDRLFLPQRVSKLEQRVGVLEDAAKD